MGTTERQAQLCLDMHRDSPLSKGAVFPEQEKQNVNISTKPHEKCVKSCSDHRAGGVGSALELAERGNPITGDAVIGDPVTESLLELAKPSWLMEIEGGLASGA